MPGAPYHGNQNNFPTKGRFLLRKYQVDTLDAIVSNYRAGVRRQLTVLPTGAGKTVIFANIPQYMSSVLPGQMMVLAHREELIQQAHDKIKHWNPHLTVGIEMGSSYTSPNADVIVSSVATLGRKGTARIERFPWDNIKTCVIDEAHHAAAQTYLNVLERGGFLLPETDKLLVGTTATPNRGDGKALAKIFDKITFTYSFRQAIADGWLCEPIGYRVNMRANLDNVSTTKGDFAPDELADEVNTPENNRLVFKTWWEKARTRSTVIFTVNIQHAQDMAAIFRHEGIVAEAIWGDDPDRAEKLRKFNAQQIQVLCNAQLLTEGWDSWIVSCIVNAAPTKSASVFTQRAGRGSRLEEGIGNLLEAIRAGVKLRKKDFILIDAVGTSNRHSLVTLPSLLGLNAQLDLKGKSLFKAAQMLEKAQDENPHIDFSKLTDLDQLKPFIESINLWDIKYPTEVTANSELTWHGTADGAFALLMPGGDTCYIRQNVLERWEITATITGQRYRGERESVEEAFKAADNLVMSKAQEHLKVLRQHEKWHDNPATPGQINLLKRFYKGRQIPPDLKSGIASRLISDFKAKQQKHVRPGA